MSRGMSVECSVQTVTAQGGCRLQQQHHWMQTHMRGLKTTSVDFSNVGIEV